MTIRRGKNRRGNFTTIPNESLRDKRLSLKARGLHHYMLSFPEDWTFRMAKLQEDLQEGRDAIQGAINELKELGYITRERLKDKSGRFTGWDTVVHDIAIAPEKLDSNPTDNPQPDNQGNRKTENSSDGQGGHIQRISNTKNDLTNTPLPPKALQEGARGAKFELEPESSKSLETDKCDRKLDSPEDSNPKTPSSSRSKATHFLQTAKALSQAENPAAPLVENGINKTQRRFERGGRSRFETPWLGSELYPEFVQYVGSKIPDPDNAGLFLINAERYEIQNRKALVYWGTFLQKRVGSCPHCSGSGEVYVRDDDGRVLGVRSCSCQEAAHAS